MHTLVRISWRGKIAVGLAILLGLGSLFLVHKTAAEPTATTIVVTSTDGGSGGPECRLRDAITAANTSGAAGGCNGSRGEPFIIELADLQTYQLTVIDNPENGLPIVASDITINGHDSSIQRFLDASTPNFRLFEVADTGILTLKNVWVRNGGNLSEGGGLHNSGIVYLDHSYFFNNVAEQGAGVYNEESAQLEINQSRFLFNYGGCGGAITNDGVLTMTKTTLIGNVADI